MWCRGSACVCVRAQKMFQYISYMCLCALTCAFLCALVDLFTLVCAITLTSVHVTCLWVWVGGGWMEMLFMHFYAKQLCWLNWVCFCGECVTSSHVLLLVWTDTHICKLTSWNSKDSSEWLNKTKCFFCCKRDLPSLGLKGIVPTKY